MNDQTSNPEPMARGGGAMYAPDPAELLLEAQAAEYLKLSVHSLRKYRQVGGGPGFCQLAKQRVAYRRKDLDCWVDARIVTNTTEGQHVSGRKAGRKAGRVVA